MKRNLLWTLLAALAFTGCSEDELLEGGGDALNQNAVTFGTYVSGDAQSRATVVDNNTLQTEGFGVNAWYTEEVNFDVTSINSYETFMTKTKVTFNKEKNAWTYSPLKYWPNNKDHKVSFFAYGPYSVNNMVNDTYIDFIVADNVKEQIDLIYHNQTANSTIDIKKPAVGTKVEFKFDHALSRISFSVEAASDVVSVDPNTSKLDANTVINVKKVVVMEAGDETAPANPDDPAGPFYKSGKLNLVDGSWNEKSVELQGFTFTGEHFYRTVKADDIAKDPTEEIDVVQLHKFNNKQDLLNNESYLMIIPNTKDEKTKFNLYIEYDVITETPEGKDVSKITNCITSDKPLEVGFKQGMAYNFNLVLGMTSVQFNVAEVTEWNNATGYEGEEWLPGNKKTSENALLLNQKYNKSENAFEIATTEDLQALSGAVNEGAQYTLDKDGNPVPVPVVASRAATRSGEEGEEEEEEVHSYASAKYIQVATIDLTGIDWEPIGKKEELAEEEYDETRLFSGTYDAQSHSITYALDGKDFSGIFRAISNAVIKGLTVNGTITNSKAESTGGIVGESVSEGATISNCHFQGSITTGEGAQFVGGIIGNADYVTTIEGCSNGATLTVGDEGRIGGIAGNVNGSSSIYACYNYGAVTANSTGYAGAAGIVGQLDGNYIELFACYNTGVIKATGDGSIAGEIVSYIGSENTVENNCYGGSNYAYDGSLESELINYRVGDGGPLQHWFHNSEVSTALNVMNNALAANDCEWKYVDGDETIKLTVVNEPASEVTIPASEVTKENAKKGDLAMKDGTFLSVYGYTTLTDEQKSNCGGVVFWTVEETISEEGYADRVVKTSLDTDKILGSDYSDCKHGLIVALEDLKNGEDETMKWQETNEMVYSAFQNSENFDDENKNEYVSIGSDYDDNNPGSHPQDFIYGYQNTKVLLAYNTYCSENDKEANIVLPVKALNGMENIQNATSWYIPSMKELHILSYKDVDMVKKYGVYTKDIVDCSLALVGGEELEDGWYWSSTEQISSNNDRVDALELHTNAPYGQPKYYKYYVRAVCAY